jgi:hypothetical protein
MFQFPGQGKPAQGILFDCDFARTADTVLALALLHGLEGKKDARVASISINRPGFKAAQLVDVIEKFYASATTGPAAQFFAGTPIGLVSDGPKDVPYSKLFDKYTPRLKSINDTAEPAVLLRNVLTAQYDQSAVMVLSGAPVNLAALLALKGGRDLVQQKVKLLTVAASALPAELSNWPTPIVIAKPDIGAQVLFPATSIENDFAYSPNHPVADAYRALGSMPYDAPAQAMAAMLYGARPKEGYFKLSEPADNVRYLIPDPERSETIRTAYTQLASAKPVPRAFRKPPQDEVDEKKDPSEKPVSKPKPDQQG